MFYVLNFDTHQFTSCDDLMAADAVIRRALIEGHPEDSLEIVNGLIDDVRLNVDAFRALCVSEGFLVEAYPIKKPEPSTLSSRIAGIQNYKVNSEILAQAAAAEKADKTNALVSQILALKPRIDALLETGNACVENGIEINAYMKGHYQSLDTYEQGTFVTNGISHRLGFAPSRFAHGVQPLTELGINNGGACGPYDFRTNGESVYFIHETDKMDIKSPSYRLRDLEKFLRDFDKFESAFFGYVDKTLEKQSRSVDKIIANAQSKSKISEEKGSRSAEPPRPVTPDR